MHEDRVKVQQDLHSFENVLRQKANLVYISIKAESEDEDEDSKPNQNLYTD